MYLDFNEASIHADFMNSHTKEEIRDSMSCMCQLLRRLQSGCILDGMIATDDIRLNRKDIAYGMYQWMYDKDVRRAERQFWCSFLGNRTTWLSMQREDDFEIGYQGSVYKSMGCADAVSNENTVLSLGGADVWREDEIEGEYLSLDDSGSLVSERKHLRQINEQTDVDEIMALRHDKLADGISSGIDLWENREILYPNLIFCEQVRENLKVAPQRVQVLQIMKRLQILQDYFTTYNGAYDVRNIGYNARSESESVRRDEDLKKQRLFRLPNGSERYFFDHISFQGSVTAGRIYFGPAGKDTGYIAYIGRHPSSGKYKF